MANLWLKIKVWTKIIVFSAIALYVLLFLYSNSGKPVKVWLFFNNELERSTLWLAMTAFAAGAVATLVTQTLLSTMRQLREMRQQKQDQLLHKNVANMHAKAAMLQTKPASESKPAEAKSQES